MKQVLKYFKGDTVIWIIISILLALSLVSVYSFVPILVKTEGGTPFKYLAKHLFYIILGIVAMWWIHQRDPKYFSKLAKFGFYAAIVLLIFTFFFGVRVNDASRWIRVPIIGLTFQTSDFAKLALIIYTSKQLVRKKDVLDDWKTGFWPIILPIGAICILIAKDNFSTAAILFMICLGLLFIGKIPLKKMAAFFGGAIGFFGLIALTHVAIPALNLLPRLDTWLSRFDKAYSNTQTFVENAQALNAEQAIHSGSFFGVGVGDGVLKSYLPEAYADFYFSSFVEEFGLLIAILLIFIYLILFYRIIRIGLKSDKLFETYVSIGIGMLLLSQAAINMMVCTGLMPVTGQNIPFLSMGGSAMLMNCVAIGIVQSFANKQSSKTEETKNKTSNQLA